jgi:hypothetical protein
MPDLIAQLESAYAGALLFGLLGFGIRWSGQALPNHGSEPADWRAAAGQLLRLWLEATSFSLVFAAAALAAAAWLPGIDSASAIGVAAFLGAALSGGLTRLVARPAPALRQVVKWAATLMGAWRGGGGAL